MWEQGARSSRGDHMARSLIRPPRVVGLLEGSLRESTTHVRSAGAHASA